MNLRVVIVGGVAGGASAAARLRRLNETAQITIFEKGPFVSFANCGLPYELGGEIATTEKLLVQTPERLHNLLNIDVFVQSQVVEIDLQRKQAKVRNLLTDEVSLHEYDKLILATGAVPLMPSIPGMERPGLFCLRTIPDLENIQAWLAGNLGRRAVIVGAGFIGLEVAEQLRLRGLEVSLVERAPQVLPPLDVEMAQLLLPTLSEQGIQLFLEDGVVAFEPPTGQDDARASVVHLQSGKRLQADVIVLGIGVRPEVSLAQQAGLKLGPRGGLQVDEYLCTSDSNVYAVGDAIEVVNPITHEISLVPLAGPANRQGRTAADNIAGARVAYSGTLGTAIVRVFGRTAAVTGASERTLRRLGRPYQALHLHPNSHAGYYPGAEAISLKVLFDPGTGKLLGAQAVGGEGVDKRIDVLATALRAGMGVDDLAELELAYAPMFGSAKDPINLAGMAAQNILRGKVETVQWHELLRPIPEGVTVLDVRENSEQSAGFIPAPRRVQIPLGQLRKRLAELDLSQEYWVHCATGQRSYNACRILIQRGFRCKNVSGSYKTWAPCKSLHLSPDWMEPKGARAASPSPLK